MELLDFDTGAITYWKMGVGFHSVDAFCTDMLDIGIVRLLERRPPDADICLSLSNGSPAETGGVMGWVGYEICGTCAEND